MIYRSQALLLLSVLAWLPVSSFAYMYVEPEPFLLESADGDLRFVPFQHEPPLVLGDQVYRKSGLYKADDATNPLWTVELKWWDGSVYLSDDGQYLVNFGGGVAFYKNGVAMREIKSHTLIENELSNFFKSEWDDSWSLGEAFYPNKNYFEIETEESAKFLFDITTGKLLGVERVILPNIAATITTTRGESREVVGLRQCLNALFWDLDASFVGFLGTDAAREGTQSEDQISLQSAMGTSAPFTELVSAKQIDTQKEGYARFRLKTKDGQKLQVTVFSHLNLCGNYAEGDRFHLAFAEIESIEGIRQVESEVEPAENGRLNELLQNAQAGHSWKEVSSAHVIIDSNHGRARHPCTARKHGGRSLERDRVICFDVVGLGWAGPLLRVVPPDDRFPEQFAIGEHEISRDDYAKYCAHSRRCKVPSHDSFPGDVPYNEPITGITLADAQNYAVWLSKQTGKTYRLPTRAEWEYAGYADGEPFPRFLSHDEGANCLKDKSNPTRSQSYSTPTAYGYLNAWSFRNFAGNVQEWTVEQNGEIRVSGGHYRSSDTECSVQFSETHSGQADKFTGFRLVREEIDEILTTEATTGEPPAADAGPDQRVVDVNGDGAESAALDDTGSSDASNYIKSRTEL